MTALATLVWILNLLAGTAGQLFFKAAALEVGHSDGWQRWQLMLKDKWIWLGVVAYILDIVLWLALVSMVPLSVAVLLASLSIMCVMLGGRWFFAEKITRQRAIAVCLITVGVALVGWSQ
jgi:drug/metabolite transporter (DMT)-like permease